MTMGCLFVAFRNCNSTHSLSNVQSDHDRGGAIVRWPTGVLEDVEVLVFYNTFRLAGYDPVLRLLAFRLSEEIDWSRCGGDYAPFIGYDFKTEQVYHILPLHAKKWSKKRSGEVAMFQATRFDDCKR